MESLLDIFTSSRIYSGIGYLITSLWNAGSSDSIIGRIFVITGLSYFLGYSLYRGYLAGFSGGFGGLLFSRIGFHVADLITLFPMAVITTVDIGTKLIRKIFLWMISFILYVISSFLAGWYLGSWIAGLRISPPQFIIQFIPLIAQITPLLYTVLLALTFHYLPGIFKLHTKWKSVLRLLLLQTLSTAMLTLIVNASIPIPPPESYAPDGSILISVITAVFREVIAVLVVFILLSLPLLLGRLMAKTAIDEHILSRVSALTLKQPLSCLGIPTPEPDLPTDTNVPWKQRWFTRTTLPITIEPDVYTYRFPDDQPFYLIASFSDTTAFYRPQKPGVPTRGDMIMITHEIIQAVVLCSAKM